MGKRADALLECSQQRDGEVEQYRAKFAGSQADRAAAAAASANTGLRLRSQRRPSWDFRIAISGIYQPATTSFFNY